MAAQAKQRGLFPHRRVREDATVINDRCLVRTQDRHRVVLVSGIVLAQYTAGDRMAEAHAMVSLVDQGWADQNDVARAFGRSARTVRRYQDRFETGGLAALGRTNGYPRGWSRLVPSRTRLVQRLKAVRKLLRRMGWRERTPEQVLLPVRSPDPGDPNLSAFSSHDENGEPLPVSLDTDPADRRMDRLFAYLGLLEDAAPWFRSATRVPRAGVLLAMPALVGSGVFTIARKIYGGRPS